MRHVLILGILLGLMYLVGRADVVGGPAPPFDTRTLVATGFILLAASALGGLFRAFRLPALLGYLAAGVVFGPSLASIVFGSSDPAPLPRPVLEDLGLVNVLAVGVIGTMGGGEIHLPELRENFKKLSCITGMVFLLVLPAVAGLVFGLSWFLPDVVPFLNDVPVPGRIAASLLFGALAVGMSPAATLALLQEVRAHGRFTSLVLGVVVLGDLVLVATFLVVLALAKLLVSPDGFSVEALLEALPGIGAEFGWALLLGVLVGVVFILYLRLVKRELLLFSLAVIFVTAFVASRLHAETLLAFLVAGFVVQNFSSHGHTLIEAFERIALPVFVIYFTTQAAALDLVSVSTYLPLTLILVTVRCGLFYFGVGWGARLARVDDAHRGHLKVSFFSQGGVDLVLAAMVAAAIPGWGGAVQTVTMATILFYIVGGPAFLARALDSVGESAAARERGAESLAERKHQDSKRGDDGRLSPPRIDDTPLGRRLAELHRVMVELDDSAVRGGVLARAAKRREFVAGLAHSITRAVGRELYMSEEGSPDPDQVERISSELDHAVATAEPRWSSSEVVPLSPKWVPELAERLTAAESFSSSHRVQREPSLFEPRGTTWQRLIRLVRRARKRVLGPGMRTVPTGRLWRYHVALDVPAAVWSMLRPREAELWHKLAEHYRVTRRDITLLLGPTAVGPAPDLGISQSLRRSRSGADPPLPPAERLKLAREQAQVRERALLDLLAETDQLLERGLQRSLANAWNAFLDAVDVAGTLEYPAWRYRLSRRYDIAQAATAELRERLERDRELAAGVRDDAAAMAYAQSTAAWIRDAAGRHATAMEGQLTPAIAELSDAISVCALRRDGAREEPPPTFDAASEGLQRSIDQCITALDQAQRRMQRQAEAGRRAHAYRAAVESMPETLCPLVDPGAAGSDREARRLEVRLAAWLDQSMVRDFAVAVIAADDHLESAVGRIRVGLHHARQVVEYHALAVGDALEVDEGLGERVGAMLQRTRTELEAAMQACRRELGERADLAARSGVAPIESRNWAEIRRQLRRADEVRPAAVATQWVRERRQRVNRWALDHFTRIRHEVAALFAERSTPEEVSAFRKLLFGPPAGMPEVYQRLFTSVPAESVGLIVERDEAPLLRQAAEHWVDGRRGAVLLRGDRGSGKRTLVRQLFAENFDELEVGWIRLSPTLQAEPEVAQRIAELTRWAPGPSFSALAAELRRTKRFDADARRRVIVVENAERLFRRAPKGLDCFRRFLDLMTASDDRILWIVLLAEPAARLLDPLLELRARFPTVIEVGTLTPEQLEQVLVVRHRLSGYELRVRTCAPTLIDWSRNPGTAWRSMRKRPEALYERLWALAGGNVRQALRLWLAATQTDPDDASRAVVGPLLAVPSPLLEDLPLQSRMLLALLVLHGPLTRTDLAACHDSREALLDAELGRLAHLGLVSVEPVRIGGSVGEELLVELPTRIVQPITLELRQQNLV